MKTWRITALISATVEVDVEAETREEAEAWLEEYMALNPLLDERVNVINSVAVKL